jgi:hypothetical protein
MRVPPEVDFVTVGILEREYADIPCVCPLPSRFDPTFGDAGHDRVQIVEIHSKQHVSYMFRIVLDVERASLSKIPDGCMIPVEEVGFPTQQTFVPIERPGKRSDRNTYKEFHACAFALPKIDNPGNAAGDCGALQCFIASSFVSANNRQPGIAVVRHLIRFDIGRCR